MVRPRDNPRFYPQSYRSYREAGELSVSPQKGDGVSFCRLVVSFLIVMNRFSSWATTRRQLSDGFMISERRQAQNCVKSPATLIIFAQQSLLIMLSITIRRRH
jgi:hypothetical protein